MARPKGILSHVETKNKKLDLRLTARQYAKTVQLASYTNHKPSEILRKFITDGLENHKEDFKIINCDTSNYLSKPLKSYNNNNNKHSLSPKNNLYHKESFIGVDVHTSEKYIAKLEEYIQRPDADVLIRELYKLELKDLRDKHES